MCSEEDVGMFIDACVIESEPSEAMDVINDMVEQVEFKSA